MPGRNPDALRGALSNLNTTHAYESTSSKPSGTTVWMVYVTTMPLPSRSTCSNLFPAHFSQKNTVYSIRCPHFTHFWAKIFFLRSEEHTSELQSRQYLV